MIKRKILYYDRTDVSEGIYINESSALKSAIFVIVGIF